MKTRFPGFALFFLTVLLAITVACSGPNVQPVTIDSDEGKSIIAAAEPMTSNLFQAIESADLSTFSRDFDTAMGKAITQVRFEEIVTSLNAKAGKCSSWDVARVEKVGKYYAVIYNVHCSEEDPVTWRVVLTQSEPHQISGLWYDSPKLREK
jgi:hypothetical protein